MKKPDWLLRDLVIVSICRVARRVEADMSSEHGVGRCIHFAKTLDRGVNRGDGAFGESDDRDSVRVDATMLPQDAERPIGIHHHCQLAELLLVGNGLNYSSTGKRIELESCNPSAVQLLYPPVLACTDRTRAMHQN